MALSDRQQKVTAEINPDIKKALIEANSTTPTPAKAPPEAVSKLAPETSARPKPRPQPYLSGTWGDGRRPLNIKNITGAAAAAVERVGIDLNEKRVLANIVGASTLEFKTSLFGADNIFLNNQKLAKELKDACGPNGVQTPENCFPALNEAMGLPDATLKLNKEAQQSAEVFTYGRTTDEIKRLQTLLKEKDSSIVVDGLVGSKTLNAVSNFSTLWGDVDLIKLLPRSDLNPVVSGLYQIFVGSANSRGIEGNIPHQAGDDRITLAGGLVADGLTYNKKPVKQGTWKFDQNFDVKKLNTDAAYKDVNGVRIKRSSFKDGSAGVEEFVAAVIESFAVVAKQKVEESGQNWDLLSTPAKRAIVSAGWNIGEGHFASTDMKAAYTEMSKEKPNQAILHKAFLSVVTIANGGAATSLARRRAEEWNAIAGEVGGTKIERVTADNSGTNTVMQYYDSNDNLLFEKQTDRASKNFANLNVTQRRNPQGIWVEVPNSTVSSLRPKPRPTTLKAAGKAP